MATMETASRADDERALETREWLESFDEVLSRAGPERVRDLLQDLTIRAQTLGVRVPFTANTPYVNTIPRREQPAYPGDLEVERRLRSLVRWNAMAMVVRANREEEGIGGHIATYASAATLFEVGFNHFWRAPTDDHPGDLVYFQGHASPGVYARAFLEGRLPAEQLANFRHELHETPGLSSYPHPWLMPDFWQFPTVSMGLGPICAIYHARFIKYLEDRGLTKASDRRIWVMMGDGETDEPESLGAITLASREHLDNLIFVVNCNLQRLDGPVRGNGKVIQELEAAFRGAGWNVIKVLWGGQWDGLLEQDHEGRLVKRMQETVDGQFQRYVVGSGAYFREDFFGRDPELLRLVEKMTDDQLVKLNANRGGHDPEKIHAAYAAAVSHTGAPTVILCKTIKGYGMGESGEGQNITHQQKKLNEEALRQFRTRFSIPISDEDVDQVPFYCPPDEGEERVYLQERRRALGGYLPQRRPAGEKLPAPPDHLIAEFLEGTGERAVSTTMAFVRILSKLLQYPDLGPRIVPMVPDEARTFGMEALFRKHGIYSHPGQLYEPVDRENLLYYREATDGQILEEGITEAGCMGSFIAAGTAYANHGISMLPFFTFYSMFGMQRVGDLVWAAADSRCRGFLMGATSGRTTLAGEGLQHQDGNSHLMAMTVPNLRAYDPGFAYELAVIIQDGIRRMYGEGEDVFYYITLMNENYPQPPMPEGANDGILRGLYAVRAPGDAVVRLVGSGAILPESLRAAEVLDREFGVRAGVWSATSYKELYREALSVERWNRNHPQDEPRTPYVVTALGPGTAPVVAATDYVRALPESVGRWIPGRYVTLGTDGFGRSDGRPALRRFFEVDAAHIAYAALVALAADGAVEVDTLEGAAERLGIDRGAPDPETR
jgi:pyruvate dehydrogenase E1 component